MSIPLDRLYHYIESIAEEINGSSIVIYRFYPHGSKKLEDLCETKLLTWKEMSLLPGIFCHDQEPLNYNFYENYRLCPKIVSPLIAIIRLLGIGVLKNNLKRRLNIYDQTLLLHSEQRSKNLEQYKQNKFITIYYWNHAVLALDWFRYAEHVSIKKKVTKNFLIYNRAWTGTREYRLKFADLLADNELTNNCSTSVALEDYKDHQFANPIWKPKRELEKYFTNNSVPSWYSADFTIEDYALTDIEVVLETMFDDDRLHLTEKSLRPISLAQPFILAATHGSLEYLRSYGFKTFDSVWDESYDLIEDPAKRLQAVIKLMKTISQWDPMTRLENMNKAQAISAYNKQYFFSKEFFTCVTEELKNNLTNAINEFNLAKSSNNWLDWWDNALTYKSICDYFETTCTDSSLTPNKKQFNSVYKEAKKYIK